jgi:LacI family transcriptional regulator
MRKARRIGIVIDGVRGYGRGVISGIVAYSRAHPHWTIAAEPYWMFASPPEIDQMNVDGLIVQIFNKELEDKVVARGLPAVNISSILETPSRLPSVLIDHEAVAKMGIDYLLSLGLGEIGYCWPGNVGYGRIRLEVCRRRVKQKGARFHECNASTDDPGQWLARLPKPVGILGCNDDWGRLLVNAAHFNGVKVPEQVAVLGVDDDAFFNTMLTPALTSIALPAEELGHRAAALLDRLMDGKSVRPAPMHLKPVRVVVRGSSDIVWVGDEDVEMALRFIRLNAGYPLQISDVLEHVPLSRRSLSRRFRQKVGRSVSAEIRRAHVERAKQLLHATDMSMRQVAAASGFVSSTRLGIIFRKDVGETPTEFRWRTRMVSRLQKH